jgi:hypothetical protein
MENRFCAKYRKVEMPEEWTDEIWESAQKNLGKAHPLVPLEERVASLTVTAIDDRRVLVLELPPPPEKANNSAFFQVFVVEVFLVQVARHGLMWAHPSQLDRNSFIEQLRSFWRKQCATFTSELNGMIGLQVSKKFFSLCFVNAIETCFLEFGFCGRNIFFFFFKNFGFFSNCTFT